ncbi:MAG: peroxiredoxin [Terrimicrobiaceae bacterium]
MRKFLFTLTAMSLMSLLSHASPLTVGAQAPDVTAPDQDGNPVRIADSYTKGLTLLYFYPKADTPGCTAQACSLRDSFADLKGKGLTIYGVSGDSPAAQKKFREKYSIPFTLLSDSSGEIAKAFGVPTVLGISKRQSFLIKDGKIAWVATSAKTGQHAQEVQQAIERLSGH